jgi:hypothetical protein
MIHVYKPRSDWYKRSDLTEGKQYDCHWNEEPVYSSDGIYYKLVNDLGKEIEVHESQFMSLDKWREKKLNEIGL